MTDKFDFRQKIAFANDVDEISEVFRAVFGTPPSHGSPFFLDTLTSVMIPLDKLVAREAPNPDRVKHAHEYMQAAKDGIGKKRKPIHVIDMGNGKYKVLDGNTTLAALLEMGQTEAVVEVKNSLKQQVGRENQGSVDAVYEQAAAAQPAFREWAQEYARKFNGKLMMRPGLKGKERAAEKVRNDYFGVAARLTDIVGGMIIFDEVEDVAKAYRQIVKDPAVYKAKNRFEKPTSDGYMDVLLVVSVGGHLCELQLNTEAILEAKEKGLGHKIYEVSRQLEPIANDVENNGELAYIAQGHKERLRKLSVKFYRNAAMSSASSSANTMALDSEISDEFDLILNALSESVIRNHFDISLPAIRNTLPLRRSMAKGTSSFSTNSKFLLSDIAPPPFDTGNITRNGKKINPKIVTGRPTRAYLSNDVMLYLQYAVIEASELVTSHREDMTTNDEFPAELQPRDRTRDAMVLQIEQIANKLNPDRMGGSLQASTGAPIVGPDMVVESGNGRTIAIVKRYRRDGNHDYRAWLDMAGPKMGLSKADLAGFTAPVLVRVRLNKMSRVDVAERANAGDIASMSPSEQAKIDARRLKPEDMDAFRPAEDGSLINVGNRAFMDRFMQTLGHQEATGLLTAGGQATRQLVDRIKAAVFHAAYSDENLLAIMAEEAIPDLKNVVAALTLAAKDFARLKALGGDATAAADELSKAVVGGVQLVRQSRHQGVAVAQVLAQMGLFEQVAEDAKEIARFIDANVRKQARMGSVFGRMASTLREYFLDLKQDELFGGKKRQPTVQELLTRAVESADQQRGLFESADGEKKN